jgi:hypothetical protein
LTNKFKLIDQKCCAGAVDFVHFDPECKKKKTHKKKQKKSKKMIERATKKKKEEE